jgi:CBS domain containing-hemolysin-like protein
MPHAVLPSSLLRLQLWSKSDRTIRIGDIKGSPYVVVRANAQLLDVLAMMRAQHRDVALITREGELRRADDELGIVTWADIVEHSSLPHHMLLLNRPGLMTGPCMRSPDLRSAS